MPTVRCTCTDIEQPNSPVAHPVWSPVIKAKRLLGWSPKHTITDDLAEYYEGYKAAGKHEAQPDFNKVRP